MLFGRKNQLIGLDIGTSSLKIAEIHNTKKGLFLKKIAVEKFSPDVFSDGEPKDPQHLSSLIRDAFMRNKIGNKNVAMSIGGYSAIVKPITITAKEDQDIHNLVFEEAEHYIPFDISEVSIDYQIMGELDQNPNQLSVLLVAAKNDMINKYVSIAENAGLNPVVMDIDAFAVQNIFEINEPDVENAVLINVGANKISLNVVNNRKSVFMREVAMGSFEITQAIMSLNSDLTLEEAEKIKAGSIASDKVGRLDVEQAIAVVSKEWCVEIERALEFFYSNNQAQKVEKVYVCGGGSVIEKFRNDLSSYIEAEVIQLNPFQVIETGKSGWSKDELSAIGPELCVALGLGLRTMDDK
ncbi:MAG: type IV pilus assembly protein PilM [Desulforegulaceae bacterium]|nr:type IV pilus assembly protein PilM [Desulforegulaceae bacterium]